MKTSTLEFEDKVRQLLTILDTDIENIQQNMNMLNDLRGFVIKRDDKSLEQMLESLHLQPNRFKDNELQRTRLREELAHAIGSEPAKVNLSAIESVLTGDMRRQVREKKFKLKLLTAMLRKEHTSTAKLLSDCARFNSMLLKCILETGRAKTITYNPQGLSERQSSSAIMNMEL
ncbi:MAG: hypothetical protein LLF92_01315 [Planctomycetaceae bacterium]|nr:hypothetical protein [Planctomycetaceae bacterium]